MKHLLFTIPSNGSTVSITDESAASSYGVPVLLLENEDKPVRARPLGPADELAVHLTELFLAKRLRGCTDFRRVRKTRAAVAACERFLEAGRPLVVRVPTPGYVAVPYGGMIGGPRAEAPKV
ncbi:MAG: hypothetical protein IPP07_00505 [Holophagales bacterium]|nr:hypothetical protein [Holophagales bacterium]